MRLPIFVFLLLSLSWMVRVADADWPQINGPNRDGRAVNETLLKTWPKELKKLWSHPVGQGFAGPAVTNEQVIIFHRPGKTYLCESLDPATGKVIWSRKLVSDYRGGGPDSDAGPKCVPLIDDDSIFLFGTGGNLICLSRIDGSTQWAKNVQELYNSPAGYFGSGSTPLLVNEKLIVNVGGKEAAVVAFDKTTGKEIWKSFDDRASYSSPIVMNVEGKPTVIVISRFHLLGLGLDDGKVQFSTKFGVRGPSVNGAMPVAFQSRLFVNSAYGVGAKTFDVSSSGLEELWSNNQTFSSQYSTPVNYQGNLFGTAGREDYGNGSFRCIDPGTGKVLWSKPGIAVGHSMLVGDQVLFLGCKGKLRIIDADPKRFQQIAEYKLFGSGARAMPALNNGVLFARSNARATGELVAFVVGKQN